MKTSYICQHIVSNFGSFIFCFCVFPFSRGLKDSILDKEAIAVQTCKGPITRRQSNGRPYIELSVLTCAQALVHLMIFEN